MVENTHVSRVSLKIPERLMDIEHRYRVSKISNVALMILHLKLNSFDTLTHHMILINTKSSTLRIFNK